ncbi:MAG: hypothetical protein OXL97_15690 [Chloroflexota bacterium]|nr:hypothetical protein [Chloroflexota bacterium]MDE2885950.1 hypothetical protein [Chloroflexota bacterium]
MRWTEKRLGGWSLLVGSAAVAVGYALSPGRGAVDTVPSTSLSDLTLAMARNEALSYTVPIVIIFGAVLMLHGLVTLWRHAAPVPRLGLLAMAIALALQMVMRGFDYMITGMGVASLESSGTESEEWLKSAVHLQRVVWGLLFTSNVAGLAGIAVVALGFAFRPEPLRLPPVLNGIVAVLAVASLVVFVTAWHSDRLELAFAPVFAAMSVAGLVYMVLLGWGLASSKDIRASEPDSEAL